MPRLKPKALSNPPSQPLAEGGLDSATTLTPITVAPPTWEEGIRNHHPAFAIRLV